MSSSHNLPKEEVVNTLLAGLLQNLLGGSAHVIPEKLTVKQKRFDIKILFKDIEFVVEASYSTSDAEKDAIRRIEEGIIDTVSIALYYDPSIFDSKLTNSDIENTLKKAPLYIKVFSQGQDLSRTLISYIKNKPFTVNIVSGWITISLSDFPLILDAVIDVALHEDIISNIASKIQNMTDDFTDQMKNALAPHQSTNYITQALYDALFSTSSEKDIKAPNVPLDVVYSQAFISLLLASTFYESIAFKHNLRSLRILLHNNNNDPFSTLESAFNDIIKVDYESIFDIGLSVLNSIFGLSNYHGIKRVLNDMIQFITQIVANKALLKQDFVGQVYHRVIGDIAVRKSYATYYTKSPIALFLSFLAINSPNADWKDSSWEYLDELRDFKIADFACGSGTLLSASYTAMLSKYRSKASTINIVDFHRTMIENVIWGFDALEQAVQTASVVLMLHEPEVPVTHMNMYHIPIDTSPTLGSLKLYDNNQFLTLQKRFAPSKTESVQIQVPSFDLVIMNPPFTRTTGKGKEGSKKNFFGFLADERVYEKLNAKYNELIQKMYKYEILQEGSCTLKLLNYYISEKMVSKKDINPSTSGLAFPFVILAHKYLKQGGRMALVLPKSVISSSSFFVLRLLLLCKYDIEYIIISQDPNNYNFSYSTDYSEVLLILRKKRMTEERKRTIVIQLRKLPKNSLEGVLLAKRILYELYKNNSSRGEIKVHSSHARFFSVDPSLIEQFVWNWSVITDSSPEILKLVKGMIS